MTTIEDAQHDWPPASSAVHYPEGTRLCGSTGQVWQVRNRQWVRLTAPKVVTPDSSRTPTAKED